LNNAKTNQMLNNEFVDVRPQKTTGAGAISFEIVAPTPGKNWSLQRIEIHFSKASTTSENFVIAKDDVDNAVYDVKYYNNDISTDSVVDIVYIPDKNITLDADDKITITYTNTDAATYGIKAYVKPRY